MMTDFIRPHVYRMPATERIESGKGKIDSLAKIVQKYHADRIIIATSNSVFNNTPNIERASAALAGQAVEIFSGCRQHSPESDIFKLMDLIKDFKADAVVSIGGSSVFDTVKVAASRVADQTGDDPVPQIAVPSTLSAGEFTPGAGYTEEATQTKQLVLDSRAAPRCVILDPEVTVNTPRELWLSTGLKALDHAMEAIWAINPHPYVDALALEAIRLLFKYLPESEDRSNLNARAACQLGAWMSISGAGASGMRLSHFLGHQVGARMHLPHGITSCVLLPGVMRHLRDKTLDAQCRIAGAMGLEPRTLSREDLADQAADHLEKFILDLGLPTSIKAAGGTFEDIDAITASSYEAAKMLGLAEDLPDGAESIRSILTNA